MSFRTAEEIRTAAITLIDNRASGIRTEAGEPIVDLIDAFSLEGRRLNVVAQYIKDINSIAGWRNFIDDESFKIELADAFGISSVDLDTDFARRINAPFDLPSDVEALIYVDLSRYAVTLGRPRSQGTFATGTLTIFLSSANPFSLQRGAAFQTGGNVGVVYDSLTDLTGVVPSFDPITALNFVNVGLRARSRGQAGNQIIGAVNTAINVIPGSVRVTNQTVIEGGTNRETNNQLLDELEGILGGSDINTQQGLLNFMESQPDVFDALVIGPGNTLMTRTTAGGVDVYVIGTQLQTNTVNVQVVSEGEFVTLPLQPLRTINSVIGSVPYGEGGGFSTPAQNPSVFEGSSVNGQPDFKWTVPPSGPVAGEIVVVNFTHNELIRRLQRFLDEDPDRTVPGSSIVVKEGIRVGVDAELKIIPLPDVSQAVAESAALTALQAELDTLLLGQLVEFSDLLTVIATATVSGSLVIDRVDGFKIGKTGTTLGVDNITIIDNEYGRLDTTTFIAP